MMPTNGLASFSVHLLLERALDSVCSLSETGATVIEFRCEITNSVKNFSAFTLLVGRQEGHPAYKK